MEQMKFLKHCILSEHWMTNKGQELSNLKWAFYYLIFTCALDYIHLFILIS
jgi:ribulose-5-phosphate 4-epimerase/fuculose-1-phosphate aldolase